MINQTQLIRPETWEQGESVGASDLVCDPGIFPIVVFRVITFDISNHANAWRQVCLVFYLAIEGGNIWKRFGDWLDDSNT